MWHIDISTVLPPLFGVDHMMLPDCRPHCPTAACLRFGSWYKLDMGLFCYVAAALSMYINVGRSKTGRSLDNNEVQDSYCGPT
ncbi:hypothetical protein L1887_38448 [Cichorium endivia]|nr:hypothetical protein L1887_38448 [Cichorium endivia]